MSLSFLRPLTFHFAFQLPGSHLLSLRSVLLLPATVDVQVLLLQWLVRARAHFFPFGAFLVQSLSWFCTKTYLFFQSLFQACALHFVCSLRFLVLLEAEVCLSFPPFLWILKERRIQWLHSMKLRCFPNPVLGRRFRCFSPDGSWSPLVCISASKLLCWENPPH